MKILSLAMKGFKGYEDSTEYSFPDKKVIIEGRNKQGKTSIGEAITWCLYGCNLLGQGNADALLQNDKSEEMIVRCAVDVNGDTYKITRLKRKSLSLKIEHFDGNNYITTRMSQKELNELLPDKDLFLSVFNPLYFLSEKPAGARKKLLGMLPKVSYEEVLRANNSLDKLDSIIKYEDLNQGLADLSIQLKKCNDNLNRRIGEKSLLEDMINENKQVSIQIEHFSEESKLEELRSLVNKKPEIIDTADLRLKLKDIEGSINFEKSQMYEVDKQVIRSLEQDIASLEGQYNLIEDNNKKVFSLGDTCKECGQSISGSVKSGMIEENESQLRNLASRINDKQESINILNDYFKTEEDNFLLNRSTKVVLLEKKANEIVANISEINKANKQSLDDFETVNKDNQILLRELEIKREKIKENNLKVELAQNNIKQCLKKLEICIGEIETIKQNITSLEIERTSLKEFVSMYVNYMTEILSSWLDKCSISLYKINKSTAELKDNFTITYENRGIGLLSNSERICVGIEIANMLNKTLNIELPTFVDNAEAILDVPEIETQMFIASVKDCPILIVEKEIDRTVSGLN